MDDYQIIELYQKRNENAIKETRDKYGNYCFRIAYNILANRQDSEECVSDTWLKAWNSIPPQNPNCLKAYLAKITRHLSFNRYHERLRDKRGGGEGLLAFEELEDFLAGTAELDCDMEKQEFIKTLNAFLHSLPKRECGIFIFRYFHMENTKSIAQAYRIKESNVLMILSRTRKKLRNILEKEGYIV